ncbi:zinc finger protein 804B [Dromiciops gliroides]|uniref:zinc finger protein 804B n=1 Tax=Dromiciops gliroides TaxID=33562 RepID=UPI001CC7849B|nr:zinc finger protein 804B [Dromiciops gliroides]
MACYLVISSRHLRNGHYRGIKGVFRGPLCKNGSPSPDDAEKEKTTAKALEDVKANFYCELCDKQYHKHQEFDNHINSYDHAHKQRLKELKQREFARNVASKSWKDEKKQEKALKRLHQLAELRQQSECVSGSGPVFKAARVAPEKQFQQEVIPFKDGRNTGYVKSSVLLKGKNFPRSFSSKQRQVMQNRRAFQTERRYLFGSRVLQPLSDGSNPCHRTGVSFSFSRKAHLKLESSASVFNENTEEACECTKSPTRKTKQTTGSWKGYTFSDGGDIPLTSGKGTNNPRGHIEKVLGNTVPMRTKVLKDKNDTNERKLQDSINIHPSVSKSHIHLSGLDLNSSFREKEHAKEMNEIEDSPKGHSYHRYQTSPFCTPQNTCKHSEYRLFECLDEFPSPMGQEHSIKITSSSRMDNRIKSIEEAGTAKRNVESLVKDTLSHGEEPKTLPFLHVLSKDGSTSLQWPTELLLFTKTKPCLSYGCNPLYFDFKHSRNTKAANKQSEENAECCMESSGNKTEKESLASGLMKEKGRVIQEDNQSLKPKKMKCNLEEKCSLKKSPSGLNNSEPNGNEQEYSTNDLNEKNPKVPAYLDASKKDCVVERHPHETESMGPLKEHSQGCQRVTLKDASELKYFSPYVSRTKKHKSATWDTHLRYKCGNQEPWAFSSSLTECISDASDGGKDLHGRMSENHLQVVREASECQRIGSSERCWNSSPKSSLDRQSSSSDISLYSTSSHRSTCSSHGSCENGRDTLLYLCKKECHPKEWHKAQSRKHSFLPCSNNDKRSSHFSSKSQRRGNCKLGGGFRNEKQSKYRYTHNRGRSRQCKTRHSCLDPKANQPTGDPSTQNCFTRHSRSSDRSPENPGICDRNSASFLRQKTDYPYKGSETQEDMENSYSSNLGKVNLVQYTSELINWPQNDGDCGNSRIAGLPISERDKTSLTALRFLDGERPEKCQEQTNRGEVFSDGCQMEVEDPSQSHFAIKLPEPVHNPPVFPLLEETRNISKVTKSKGSLIQRGAERDKDEGSQTMNDAALLDIGDENCLFKGIIQIGTDYQSPNIKMNTASKEQLSPSISGTQPFIQSSDSVPNNFPGALPSIRYSGVVNSSETKEEQKILERHDASMDMNEVEGNINSYFDSTMQKYGEIEQEVYHKSISPPLTQQPITFTPDEIDKYRLLQLQAQQHMQKQFLSKHIKATSPPAFSSTTAMPPMPVHQHTSITTIHHTLLQHFAVSASMNPHGGHLPIAHLHPLSQTHFTPISFSPLTPAIIPAHPTFLAGHPLHLVPATHIHPSHLALQPLPHAAFIPTLFRPHLNPVTASIIHLNPLIQPVFQGQDFCHHSCSGQIQQFNRVKEVLNVSAHLN